MKKYIFGATILLVAALNQAVQAQSPDQDNSMMAAVNQQDDVSEALASTKTHQEQQEPNRACYDADNNDVYSDNQLAMTDSSFLEALSNGYVGIDDLEYIGPIDSVDNIIFYRYPRDGSCSGDSFMNGSALVYATDEQEAQEKCSSLIQNPEIESARRYHIRTKFDHHPMTSNEDEGMLNHESADTIYLDGFWLCFKQVNSD